jgi:CBS domain-containing protein
VVADVPLSVVHAALVTAPPWIAFPVVDEHGALVGSLPNDRVSAAGEEPRECFLPVTERMVPAWSVRESEPLDTAIAAMTLHRLRHLPVVDDEGRVTGIISDVELLRWIARGAPERWWL